MDLKKLAPWNWFKKEQEQEQHSEIDRLFERTFRGFGLPTFRPDRDLFPDIQANWLKPMLDIRATENEYSIAVELPGVEANEVKLELVNDTLKVSGEKRQEKDEKESDFYRMERSYGSFQRVLSLPEDADQEKINAVFKNGVMTITLPRKSLRQSQVKQPKSKRANPNT